MSGGRERDSGVHDRTINETSSEEVEERRNPLENIAEVEDEGNDNIPVGGNPAQAVGNPAPIQISGNPNNPASDNDDDNDMANNAVKPGQLTALPTFDGERT